MTNIPNQYKIVEITDSTKVKNTSSGKRQNTSSDKNTRVPTYIIIIL